jgi:hypothetical protein
MQGFGADPEVFDKPAIGISLLGVVAVAFDAEQVGRMDGDQHAATAFQCENFAANLGNAYGSPQHSACRRSAKRYDKFGSYQRSLLIEPPAATIDLVGVRALVKTTLATFLEFEVLDCIGNKQLDAIKTGVSDRAVEDAASRPNERPTAQILVVARLFPDEHDASVARPLSRNNLSGILIKRAARTIAFRAAQLVQV